MHRWLSVRSRCGELSHHRPPPGCCQSLVCYRDRFLILFGGGSLHRFTNDVYVYDIVSHRWRCQAVENSHLAAPRLGHSAVVYEDSMIVYGGNDLHCPVLFDDVLQLDLIHWRWSLLQRAPPSPEGPGARRLHCAHVVGHHMYVLLGTSLQQDEAAAWALDLRTGVWEEVASDSGSDERGEQLSNTPPRLCGCSSAVAGESIFVFGGYHAEESLLYDSQGPLHYVDTLYEFQTRHRTWRQVRPDAPSLAPAHRFAASVAAHGGYVYLFGGDANQEDVAWYFNDVWRIRICGEAAGRRWEPVAVAGAAVSPRSGCAYAYACAALFIVGGELGPVALRPRDSYSDAMFMLPFGCAYDLSLRENAARWVGLPRPQRAFAAKPTVAVSLARLPLGARVVLEQYLGQ